MSKSRREFLTASSAALLASAAAADAIDTPDPAQRAAPAPQPGSPPAFGTASPVGPEVTAATFVEAEKMVQIELTEAERAQAALNWRDSMAALYERRTGPRKVPLGTSLVPYSQWNP